MMISKKVSLIISLSLAFKDLKNEIYKHFENSEEELKLVHELIHTSIFQEPIDDSILIIESLFKLMSEKSSTHPEIIDILERLNQQLWNDIQKPLHMLADYSYRSSDITIQAPFNQLSDLGRIFDDLMKHIFADSRILTQPSGVDNKHLFQTAQLINCGYYLKIILHDYLRAILGLDQTMSPWYLDPLKPYTNSNPLFGLLPAEIGNQHPTIVEADEKWIDKKFKYILETDNPDNINISIHIITPFMTFNHIKQDKDGKFKDNDIAEELIKGTEKIIGIESARSLGVASLNDLRKSLNLVPYTSFEDMTADKEVAAKLKTLYTLAFPFTISYGILSDKNLEVPDEQLVRGGVLHQLLLKNLLNCYSPNSAYAFYPFTVPAKTKEILKECSDNFWEKIKYNRSNPQI
ncbi:16867_t:CDS:10 [Dentiscutata heterogama]|uniref:16867_t:CDS:1 n=1 Tax=Dentiscutata heterogama TaxID=1316150 RepID=A0ACA9KXF2_9GLOM|nr:16867_t:CDS:10 [Dentiscutata heterogama]